MSSEGWGPDPGRDVCRQPAASGSLVNANRGLGSCQRGDGGCGRQAEGTEENRKGKREEWRKERKGGRWQSGEEGRDGERSRGGGKAAVAGPEQGCALSLSHSYVGGANFLAIWGNFAGIFTCLECLGPHQPVTAEQGLMSLNDSLPLVLGQKPLKESQGSVSEGCQGAVSWLCRGWYWSRPGMLVPSFLCPLLPLMPMTVMGSIFRGSAIPVILLLPSPCSQGRGTLFPLYSSGPSLNFLLPSGP